MYLKLQKGTKDSQMLKINEMVLKLFEYLSTAKTLEKSELKKALGTDKEWLIRYYRGLEKKLSEFMEEPLAERRKIYSVLQKDMQFVQYRDDETFRFGEEALTEGQLKKVQAVMEHLYEQLFYNAKIQVDGTVFSYMDFKSSLFDNNSNTVCPACLGYWDDLSVTGEVDHYLPKAKYPALIFQPENLTVICSECNGTVMKGTLNPLRNTDLTEIFLPYFREAEKETEIFIAGDGGERRMEMKPKSSITSMSKVQKRIENLDKLFHLHERWSKRMNNYIKREMTYLKSVERSEVEKQLKEEADKKMTQAKVHKELLLDAVCMEFLNGRGKEAFIEEWRRRQEEERKMNT